MNENDVGNISLISKTLNRNIRGLGEHNPENLEYLIHGDSKGLK
jgi:hypothetical protein